jgi:hypothetical protein
MKVAPSLERDAVASSQLLRPVVKDRESVPSGQLVETFRPLLTMLPQDRRHFLEVPLKTGRGHDLEDPRRFLGDVPHRVRDVARLNQRGASLDLLVGRVSDASPDGSGQMTENSSSLEC